MTTLTEENETILDAMDVDTATTALRNILRIIKSTEDEQVAIQAILDAMENAGIEVNEEF